jgi:hypothetical protein
MNLLEAILFSGLREIQAGGPGSGCHGPNCGRPKINEGDIVKIQKPISVWNQKTGDNDTFKPGTKATVLNVLPKVGTADQMLSVQVKRHHDAEYMKMDDVKLHKAAGPSTVETEPVPKSKIKQQFLSNDGSTMTVVKSPEMKEYTPRTIQEMADQPSRYKGQFEKIEKVDGADNQTTRVYDTSKVPSTAWGREGAPTAAPRPGVTLWVHRYPDHVTVQEQPYQRWGQKVTGIIQWRYNNVGKAFGMLKKRYGISIPLSKERF